MGSSVQRVTARSPLGLVRLAAAAAAVTGLTTPGVRAAETPDGPAPVEEVKRTDHIQSSYQTWLAFTAQGAVVAPLLVFVDLVGGFHEDMHPAALVVRPAVGIGLPLRFSIFAGYTYSSFWGPDHERGEEHTAFQQVGYLAPFPVVELSARVRWEQRFRAGSDVGYRLRTMVGVDVLPWPRAPVRLVLWDEIFFGLNQPADWQPTALDQDLFFAGVAWTPSAHFRADIGYMGALAPRQDGTALAHCLSIGTTASW
jgi:hypothetical protein